MHLLFTLHVTNQSSIRWKLYTFGGLKCENTRASLPHWITISTLLRQRIPLWIIPTRVSVFLPWIHDDYHLPRATRMHCYRRRRRRRDRIRASELRFMPEGREAARAHSDLQTKNTSSSFRSFHRLWSPRRHFPPRPGQTRFKRGRISFFAKRLNKRFALMCKLFLSHCLAVNKDPAKQSRIVEL